MGVVQGLTEFLPVSSSGHLIIVPALLGWHDPFITSLAFSVMLHVGTLVALLIYFRADWARLIPAGLATIRDRSFDGDGDRRLAWLLVVATIPALVIGVFLNDPIESRFREVGLVALMLVVVVIVLTAFVLPRFETFRDAQSYYATLAHETIHWTRHCSRLDRESGRVG